MKTLESNIINLFKDKGEVWFKKLPEIVEELADTWNITEIKPVNNMTFNYVIKAIQNNQDPVVVKISCDEQLIIGETKSLEHFHGHGAVKLLDHNTKYHAILLEQARPGSTMKECRVQSNLDYLMDEYIKNVKNLHSSPTPSVQNFPEIKKWLKVFDRVDSSKLPVGLSEKIEKLGLELCESQTNKILLHGDLHLDNILQNGNSWISIDPKGIIGEAEFEVAAFDFLSENEIENSDNLSNLFHSRINLIAKKSELNLDRLRKWCLVRLALAIAWCVEDNVDSSKWVSLYNIFKSGHHF